VGWGVRELALARQGSCGVVDGGAALAREGKDELSWSGACLGDERHVPLPNSIRLRTTLLLPRRWPVASLPHFLDIHAVQLANIANNVLL